jgi:hypothetical protein
MGNRLAISLLGLVLGLGIGIGLGLAYTWVINPVIEYDTEPHQLSAAARTQYMIAVSLAYRADSDLRTAVDRLVELRLPGDPFQALANTACDLLRQGISTTSQRNAIEALVSLYRPQGRTGCADESNLFTVVQPSPTPFPTAIPVTPTLVPPASKTPTVPAPASLTPATVAPTATPTAIPSEDDFLLVAVQTYCSTELAGLIEVYVQLPGTGQLPGIPIRVRWDGGEDNFVTGLKPERGQGYADFKMEANRNYLVEIPGRSPVSRALSATQCFMENGDPSTISYRVIFRLNQ